MEYVYAALLLHKLGKSIDESGLKKVVSATGVEVDDGKIKLLVSSLKDVNIDQELEKAVAVAAAPVASVETPKAAKEEKKEEEASAAEGLSSLFG
jgi:large subunit ribosomal protein L12